MDSKILILIRHAHRDKNFGSDADNGLSERGQNQAKKLREQLLRTYEIEDAIFASSPKRRCVETLLPTVVPRGGEKNIHKLACLDEGGSLETKVHQFIKWWDAQKKRLTFACSHGDVLPLCIEALTGEKIDLEKASWVVIEKQGKNMVLVARNQVVE
jgi:broad specificity phosphatase PhoE